jgi:hypothetical protein
MEMYVIIYIFNFQVKILLLESHLVGIYISLVQYFLTMFPD